MRITATWIQVFQSHFWEMCVSFTSTSYFYSIYCGVIELNVSSASFLINHEWKQSHWCLGLSLLYLCQVTNPWFWGKSHKMPYSDSWSQEKKLNKNVYSINNQTLKSSSWSAPSQLGFFGTITSVYLMSHSKFCLYTTNIFLEESPRGTYEWIKNFFWANFWASLFPRSISGRNQSQHMKALLFAYISVPG